MLGAVGSDGASAAGEAACEPLWCGGRGFFGLRRRLGRRLVGKRSRQRAAWAEGAGEASSTGAYRRQAQTAAPATTARPTQTPATTAKIRSLPRIRLRARRPRSACTTRSRRCAPESDGRDVGRVGDRRERIGDGVGR